MADLQQKFKSIINDLEKNLKNQDDVGYVKGEIYKIYTIFLDEFDRLEEISNQKIDTLVERYAAIEQRMNKMEESMDKMEKDIYINEDDDDEFEITCPYCDAEIIVDFSDELKEKISCPECNNIIELDWDNDEECEHDCSCCEHHNDCENEDEDM